MHMSLTLKICISTYISQSRTLLLGLSFRQMIELYVKQATPERWMRYSLFLWIFKMIQKFYKRSNSLFYPLSFQVLVLWCFATAGEKKHRDQTPKRSPLKYLGLEVFKGVEDTSKPLSKKGPFWEQPRGSKAGVHYKRSKQARLLCFENITGIGLAVFSANFRSYIYRKPNKGRKQATPLVVTFIIYLG